MPKGVSLSASEQGQISAFRSMGMSLRKISSRIGRSTTVVYNFIKSGVNYGTKKRTGRKPVVSERDKRNIKRLALNKKLSAKQIAQQLNLKVTKSRICQILKANDAISYLKRQPLPQLLPRHKTARLAFAEKYQFWEEEWEKVVFSDEKKFNLDGPDGYQYYWADKRQEREVRKARNFGGGTLMVWGAFSHLGRSPICFISTKMTAEKYVQLLDEVLVEYEDDGVGNDWVFQHDNAAVHTAKLTKTFLAERNIPQLDWPAISPDLNPIENVWALLSQRVFANGRQFDTIRQLRSAIINEWTNLDQNVLQKYIASMPRRLQHVIINKGGNTKY